MIKYRKWVRCKMNNYIEMLLTNFLQYKMISSKILEQITFNTRPKIQEHMLIVMDKSTHEELLFQTLQTNNKQFKMAVTFLSGYNGIFDVTNSNRSFFSRNRLLMRNFYKFLFHTVLTKSNP